MFIVANAFDVPIDSVNDEEVRFHFLMCSFLCNLTNSQMQMLSKLLLIVLNWKDEKLNFFNETEPPPVRMTEFQQQAIHNNLPVPVQMKMNDG